MLLCLALVVLAPLAPLAEAREHDDLANMPQWSAGDHWKWKKDPTAAQSSRSYGNLTWAVQGQENVTLNLWESGTDDVAWRTQHVWTLMSWLNTTLPTEATAFEIRQENLMHRRVADLAMVRSELSDSTEWTLENGTKEGQYKLRHYERFAPLIELQFPFAVGDEWRVRADQRWVSLDSDDCGGAGQPSCRGGGPKVFTYTVVARDDLTLTVNGEETEFAAWRIKVMDETAGRYEVWWYAEEACNVVVREQYSNDRQKIGIFTLTDFRCGGETAAQNPDYSQWALSEFSSTRFHGELSKEALAGLRRDPTETFWSPGPAAVPAALALVALAALARRLR